jgi:reactive chlorine resistance protein C
MATGNHLIGRALEGGLPPGRLGFRLAAAGEGLSLYATVLVLVLIGGLKFTAYEAEAIRPLVETSPLLSWAYAVFSPQAFSNLLGVVELTTALLLALAPFAPHLGLLGAALAAGTFAITSTFLITGPSWEASLGGFPALSPPGGFIVKDLALLGIALAVAGRMLIGLEPRVRRPG